MGQEWCSIVVLAVFACAFSSQAAALQSLLLLLLPQACQVVLCTT
jgi:hypothetical protein